MSSINHKQDRFLKIFMFDITITIWNPVALTEKKNSFTQKKVSKAIFMLNLFHIRCSLSQQRRQETETS